MKAILEVDRLESRAAPKALAPDWFSDFYRSNANFVRHLLLGLGAPPAELEDLVQEVFIVAYRKWPRPANATQVDERSWLYGVVVRVLGQERRRQRIRSFFRFGSSADLADPSTPATAFEGLESLAVVHRLLDSLPEDKRTVFVLFELEGLSSADVAVAVGCPPATVRRQLHEARLRFERFVRDEPLGSAR